MRTTMQFVILARGRRRRRKGCRLSFLSLPWQQSNMRMFKSTSHDTFTLSSSSYHGLLYMESIQSHIRHPKTLWRWC